MVLIHSMLAALVAVHVVTAAPAGGSATGSLVARQPKRPLGVPPGHGGTPPGHGGVPPGQSSESPSAPGDSSGDAAPPADSSNVTSNTTASSDDAVSTTEGSDATNSNTTSSRNGRVLITGCPVADGNVPVRMEIRDMIKDGDMFSLYLLGLRRIQDNPDLYDPMSYIQIAGIHGEPKDQAWNGDAPKQHGFGYGRHNDVNFPTWHRPHLLAYEQALYEAVQQIVKDWSDDSSDKSAMAEKAKNFRIPYWDWARKADPVMPEEIGTMETITCTTDQGKQEIENPLYRFRFPRGAESLLDMSYFPDGYSIRNYPDLINTALRAQRLNLQNEITKLYSSNDVYDAFATKASSAGSIGSFSLESIHDQIHGYVGTNGNSMADPSIAAFDPIFWLHHCFVDKLFADWQQFNGDSIYVDSSEMNTELVPFRKGDGTYWTNADVRSVTKLGYTYSNTGSKSQSNDTSGAEEILQNYPSWVGRMMGGDDHGDDDDDDNFSSVMDKIVDGNKYFEYSAAMKIDTAKYDGPVDVYSFLGDGDPSTTHDINNAILDPEFLGKYSTFSGIMKGHDTGIISAGIPITGALLRKVNKQQLGNLLEKSAVQTYLQKHFEYVVVDSQTGEQVDPSGCTVNIVYSEVTLSKSKSEMPTIQKPKLVFEPKPAPKEKFVYNSKPQSKLSSSSSSSTTNNYGSSASGTSSYAASTSQGTAAAPQPSATSGGLPSFTYQFKTYIAVIFVAMSVFV